MAIKITTNMGKIAKELDDVAKRQLPFATAVTLTKTAKRSIRENLR